MESSYSQVATREKAARIADIRPARVDYWMRTGVIEPTVREELTARNRVVLFDLRELMALLVASQLRERGISLQHIRTVVQRLRSRGLESPLTQLTFATEGREIYFQDENGEWESGRKPQHALISERIDVGLIRARIADAYKRSSASTGRTERRRGALGSKEVFEGTRVPVATVVRYVQAGKSDAQILKAFPSLTTADVEIARHVA
jgi:uncharacterized protein (DUF433 family)